MDEQRRPLNIALFSLCFDNQVEYMESILSYADACMSRHKGQSILNQDRLSSFNICLCHASNCQWVIPPFLVIPTLGNNAKNFNIHNESLETAAILSGTDP